MQAHPGAVWTAPARIRAAEACACRPPPALAGTTETARITAPFFLASQPVGDAQSDHQFLRLQQGGLGGRDVETLLLLGEQDLVGLHADVVGHGQD